MKRPLQLLAVVALLFALPAAGAVYGPDEHSNFLRLYGQVVHNVTFADGSGFLTLHVLPSNEIVRLDYLDNRSGVHDLVPFVEQYVVIHGSLSAVFSTCQDGPNPVARPVVVWRWTGSSWEIFDHDCRCWLPWP